MNSTTPEPAGQPDRRKLQWWAFWFVFFVTPIAVSATPWLLKTFPQINVLNDYGLFAAGTSLLAGASSAGFILARLISRTKAELVLRTMGLGFVFTLLLGCLSVAGCSLFYR